MIGENDKAKGMKRYAFVEPTAVDEDKDYAGWHNGGTPVDAMSDEAVQKFVDITYETYKKHVGESFGDTIPAIFTDEPQIGFKQFLPFARSTALVMLPWTTDFTDTYKAKYGEDIAEKIPELFLDLPNGEVSTARYRYHEHSCERFTESTAKKCGTWCEKNGIALTGHMMWEQSLESQTRAVGEAMRAYECSRYPACIYFATAWSYLLQSRCSLRYISLTKRQCSQSCTVLQTGISTSGVTSFREIGRRHLAQPCVHRTLPGCP